MRKARRFLETVAHLALKQIAVRISVVARRRFWRAIGAKTAPSIGATLRAEASGVLPKDARQIVRRPFHAKIVASAVSESRRIAAGEFTFLHRTVRFPKEINWNAPGESQLWRYHLQYFGWVPTLVTADLTCDGIEGFETFCRQAECWMRDNQRLRGDGWHPYTLSLRTVNWLKACAAWRDRVEQRFEFREAVIASLHAQVLKLEQQLEFDVRGNHLMENARALVWAGLFFTGRDAERWLRRGEEILASEIPEQVLEDGAHFERTPGYHTTMLALIMELAMLRIRNGLKVPTVWTSAIHRMALYLQAIRGPDRRLPLVKDTTYDAMADSAQLLHLACALTGDGSLRPSESPTLWSELYTCDIDSAATSMEILSSRIPDPAHSGFFTARGESGDFLFVDCGRPCPDYLPAHAHADSLSYEFHCRGRPLIVDSGVYEYQRGYWRDYFRSTRAHNTMEVDGENSSDVWSSFRVGRRARVRVRNFEVTPNMAWIIAEHDGYRHLQKSIMHRRCIVWRDDEFLLVLDAIDGRCTARLRNHVHLHPDAEIVDEYADGVRVRHTGDMFIRSITVTKPVISRGVPPPLAQGWYSEEFGIRVPNAVLTFAVEAKLPHVDGYVITGDEALILSCQRAGRDIVVTKTGRGAALTLRWSLDRGTISS